MQSNVRLSNELYCIETGMLPPSLKIFIPLGKVPHYFYYWVSQSLYILVSSEGSKILLPKTHHLLSNTLSLFLYFFPFAHLLSPNHLVFACCLLHTSKHTPRPATHSAYPQNPFLSSSCSCVLSSLIFLRSLSCSWFPSLPQCLISFLSQMLLVSPLNLSIVASSLGSWFLLLLVSTSCFSFLFPNNHLSCPICSRFVSPLPRYPI